MIKPLNGRGNRIKVAAPPPGMTGVAAARITILLAGLFAGGVSACSSPAIDEYLAGWQNEHDAQTHAFVHDSFVLNREAAAQSVALLRSDSLNWPHYGEPLLRTATRSRAVHQAQGRALVLERFLAHMRAAPEAAATERWFADEVAAVEASAGEAGAETEAAVRALASALPMSEESFERIIRAAAGEGRVRGEAMQLVDLRRTAARYFRRLGYDKGTLGFDRGDVGGGVADEHLLARVDDRLRWAGLRQALLQPRSCTREATTGVTCAPAPGGIAPAAAEDEPLRPPPPQRSLLPGESIRWAEPKVRAPDLLDRRPGW